MSLSTKRSADAKEWRKLYDLTLWRRLRAQQLARQPLCERHLKDGKLVPADTVHHRRPHKGEWSVFVDVENLESVCASCHSSDIQEEERNTRVPIGLDGWPVPQGGGSQ